MKSLYTGMEFIALVVIISFALSQENHNISNTYITFLLYKVMKICKINNCDKIYHAKGLCRKHYIKFKKYGDPLIVINNVEHNGICSIKDCNNKYYAKNYCEHHYNYTPVKKKARKKYNLKMYNLTPEEYEQMLKNQDNKCAICNNYQTTTKPNGEIRDLDVDHNHKTGKIRGLLCGSCNTGLGLLKEDVLILQNVIKYLLKYQ